MPYMGSKQKLSKQIVDFILADNPECKYIYDLFGGGGAISFEFLQRQQVNKVFYNELNTSITELLIDLLANGITDKYYQWVDRDTFNAHKNDLTWFGGLLQTCWSFGNNQKSYLFGKNIEEHKRLLHEIVVNKCAKSREIFPLKFDDEIFNFETVRKRRLAVMRVVKKSSRCDLERLQHLEHLEHLEQLEQLERLERLERLENLNITNASYDVVEIKTPINQTIIYLDPPYNNTNKYKEDLCHNALKDYIKNSQYKIYVSGYDNVYDLNCVLEMSHRSTLSSTNNSKKTIEKLYCNKL